MSDGVVGALIGAGVALLVAGLAALVAVYQITKQARMGLKVELYREVLTAISAQGDAERDLSTRLAVLSSLIALWLRRHEFGGNRPNPSTSWAELHDLSFKAQMEGAELICLIEKWLIVDPRLDIFKLAFGSALHEMRQAWASLSDTLGAVVPIVPGGPLPAEAPDNILEAVGAAIQQLQNALSKLGAWAADFQLEMQCLLLSDLFDNEPSHRVPLDPQLLVVRLDQYEVLKAYLMQQTAWGREMRAVEERTKAEIAKRLAG